MLNIAQSRLVDASTGTARASRSSRGTYTPSTSRHRLSGDQNVFRGVFVSVQMRATVFAVELSDLQAKAGVDMSARVAAFAAGKKAVRHAQLAPIPLAFVSQHLPKHPEAGATDVLGEGSILNHAAHVQVFNRQHVEPAHQVGGELIQRILPAVGNLGVQPCDLQPLVIPSATAIDAAGENPLQSRQPCGIAGSMARVWNSFPIGKSGQPANSKVDPDTASSLGERGLGWFIQTKTHEVSPGTVLCYRNRSGRTCETATPFDVKTTDFGKCKIAIGRIPFETSRVIFSRLLPVLGSELGVASPLGEEIGERSLKMTQGLLLGNAGGLAQPGKGSVATMLRPSRAAGVVIDRLAVLEAVRPQSQREVVGVPNTAKLPGQLPRLATCRIGPECHANFHLQESMRICRNRQELFSKTRKSPPKGGGFQPIK